MSNGVNNDQSMMPDLSISDYRLRNMLHAISHLRTVNTIVVGKFERDNAMKALRKSKRRLGDVLATHLRRKRQQLCIFS